MPDITYSLKGFFGYGILADNNPNTVAPLGELSAYARTFSRDRELYGTGSGTTPETSVDLTVFSSRKSSDNSSVKPPGPISDLLMQVGIWAYTQSIAGAFTNNPETFRQALLAQYDGKITDVTVGAMSFNGNIYLPTSVTFFINADGLGVTWGSEREFLDGPRIKLWFSDDRFRREYDEYHIEFVAPIDNLDQFFLPSGTVRELVAARTLPELAAKVDTITDKRPYTIWRAEIFNYHDPLDDTNQIPTNWNFVIYSTAGNNIDAIKAGLQEWILAHSTHTREEWAEIFPDIFTATEFIVTPFWSQFAVENMTIQAGVYSPVCDVQQALAIARETNTGTGYTIPHVENNLALTGIPFKSIALGICGGPENRQGKARFKDYYWDYMNVSTTHPDFGRMSADTQGLVLMFERMLQVAETMTEFSDIPNDMTRLARTNSNAKRFLYLVKSYRDIQYLMVAGPSLQGHFPPSTYSPLDLTNEGAVGLTTMPHGYTGSPYSTRFEALGGTGIYTYTLLEAAHAVIVSHSIDPITGEYTATFDPAGGDATVSVRVSDSSNDHKTVEFSLHVIVGSNS